MPAIEPGIKAQIAAILADEKLFVRNCLNIKDKKGQSVRFLPNRPQRLFEERSSEHKFVFVIKGRKLGISSRIIAGDIWACATKNNEHAICLTQTGDDAEKMLEERIKPMIRDAAIPLGAIERDDYIFFPQTKSKYYIGTAGAKKFGRGSDITRYHFSEFAHWPDMEVVTGIEQGCVDNAIGRIETTANGYNFAQQLWADCKLGKKRYHPIFIPWYADDAYRIAGAKIDILSEEEHKLVEAYGLDHEQLAWRRAKVRDMSKPELFPQEYPSNDIEAFISSGRPVFDWISLQRHEGACSDPRWVGDLRDDGRTVQLLPSPNGSLKVWRIPETNHVYVLGADVAEGLEDGSFSVAEIVDAGTDEQVAEWHGHIAPDLFADILINIGRYYNGALIAPESWPGPGEVTEKYLETKGYRNLYKNIETAKGWETNKHTKQKAVLDLVASVRDLKIGIKSKFLVSEMRSYMYSQKGAMEPATGSFSDRIMAMAICWQVSRPLANRTHYESPKLRDMFSRPSFLGGATIPQWKGPVMGVRRA